jgi:DNA-directed RNA polymerase subunit RPC12/RpoP
MNEVNTMLTIDGATMPKYVDAEALNDALYDADAITFKGLSILRDFPAADVVPVAHGHWTEVRRIVNTRLGKIESIKIKYTCSQCCGYVAEYDEQRQYDYCPHCGAKMT